MHTLVAQSYPTLYDPKDCGPPGLTVHGILQDTRILEWAAIHFSRRSSPPRDRTQVSCIVGRCFTIWTIRETQEWSVSGAKHSKKQQTEVRWLERSPSSPNLTPSALWGSYRGNQPDSQTALLLPSQRALRSEARLGSPVGVWQAL